MPILQLPPGLCLHPLSSPTGLIHLPTMPFMPSAAFPMDAPGRREIQRQPQDTARLVGSQSQTREELTTGTAGRVVRLRGLHEEGPWQGSKSLNPYTWQ